MADDYVIAIPIYNGVDLMDVAAPYEIFNWMAASWTDKEVKVHLVAESLSPVKTRDHLEMMPHRIFEKVPHVDLLWIPGGDPDALVRQMGNAAYVHFLQSRAATAQYVASVCEGALIAANAGLLDGYEATTHWAFIECLRCSYPKVKVHPGYPRYVHDRNRITGGGISSGLDEAFYVARLLAGEVIAESVQVTMQYFPQPPFLGTIPSGTPCPLQGRIPVHVKAG